MAVHRVDVDSLLEQEQLELCLGGKTYVIRDVPLELLAKVAQLGSASEGASTRIASILSDILGPEFDSTALGTKAANMTLRALVDFVSKAPAEVNPS